MQAEWTKLSDSPTAPMVRRESGGLLVIDAIGSRRIYITRDEKKTLAKFLLDDAIELAAEEAERDCTTVERNHDGHLGAVDA
jgi:hypothetical protein